MSPSLPPKEYFLVDSDQLEELIIQLSPEIRHDTRQMADLIAEIVHLEREKRGLGIRGGKGTLELNKHRRPNSSAPDFTGEIAISGKHYLVKAYVGGNQQFINLTFTPV
jgi:hypothetical protein